VPSRSPIPPAASPPSPPDAAPRRYGALLLLVLLCIVVLLVVPGETLGLVVSIALQAVTIGVALAVADARPTVRRRVSMLIGGVVLATAAGMLLVLAAGVDPILLLASTRALLGLLLAFGVPVLIVRDVTLRHRTITMQTVAAGLCVYLLLGLAFSFAHGLTDLVAPGSYTSTLGGAGAVYLSFVTLTTVGFGDITPVGALARALIVIEAVIGQIYLVSVVALIVGNVVVRPRP
jgi:hypothetical protein